MNLKSSFASVALVLAGGGAFAQNWQPLNPDWDYYLDYDGEDIAQGWSYDPQTNQIISQHQETTWPETIQAPQGIHNYSNNALLTTYWNSEGSITIHLRWRHSNASRPVAAGILVQSPANAQAVGPGPILECEGGIGIDPWYQGNGLVTTGKRLRIVSIGGNGEGEIEIAKTASASLTGAGAWVVSSACEIELAIDTRVVKIFDQFGTGWPTSPSGFTPKTHFVAASQDYWEWYQPIDSNWNNRPVPYIEKIPLPAVREFPDFLTDYSEWHVGVQIQGQILRLTEVGAYLEPPTVPNILTFFGGLISDGQVGEEWSFSGYSGVETNILTEGGNQLINYVRSLEGPIGRKTQNISPSNIVTSESSTTLWRQVSGPWDLKLVHEYNDGAIGESTRLVHVHLPDEEGPAKGPQSGDGYLEFNVPVVPSGAFYKATAIVDPLTGAPSLDVPEVSGWVSPGYESAIFRQFVRGYHEDRALAENVIFLYTTGQQFAPPQVSIAMGFISIPFFVGLNATSPPVADVVFERDDYWQGGSANHRYCDWIKADLPGASGEKNYSDPAGLLALKANLNAANTQVAYWKVHIREYHNLVEHEKLKYGPSGFLGQSWLRRKTERPFPDVFKRFFFSISPENP